MEKLREWIDAFKRLEMACVAGMDEEFRDDVLLLLVAVSQLRDTKMEMAREAKQYAVEAGRLAALLHDAQRDAERLDYVLSKFAWIRVKYADSGAATYWLETQDEDENFIRLSGSGFFASRKDAIDAAMAAEKGAQG